MTVNTTETPALSGGGTSREVNCFAVHQFLAPHLGDPEYIPGTPSWTELPDDNGAKWRAVLWAAMWWVVAEDARQDAVAKAGQDIWTGTFATTVARHREIDSYRRTA